MRQPMGRAVNIAHDDRCTNETSFTTVRNSFSAAAELGQQRYSAAQLADAPRPRSAGRISVVICWFGRSTMPDGAAPARFHRCLLLQPPELMCQLDPAAGF